MTDQPTANLLWGCAQIARFLGRTERSVFHMLEANQLPGATKIGGRWVLDVDVFRRKIEEAAA